MSKSREDWIKLVLQMLLLYQVSIGINVMLQQSSGIENLIVTLVFMPLAGLLFLIRKAARSFFTGAAVSLGSSALYGAVVWMGIRNLWMVLITAGIIAVYSVYVAYIRTSLQNCEYISEKMLLLPMVFYIYAVWRGEALLRTISCWIFLGFILLQLIYNYEQRTGVVLKTLEDIEDLEHIGCLEHMEQLKHREHGKQIRQVTKTLTGILCIGVLVIFLTIELLAGNLFEPVRDALGELTKPLEQKTAAQETTAWSETMAALETIPIGEVEAKTGELVTNEVQKETGQKNGIRMVYAAACMIGVMIFVSISIVIAKWFALLRQNYEIDHDVFERIDESDGQWDEIVSQDREKSYTKQKAHKSRENILQRQVRMEKNEAITRIKENVAKVIVGKQNVIDCILVAMLSEGHILLEDVPGTGKTVLAKTFAKSIGAEFGRIQFTADLLPTDITGLNFYNQKLGGFQFRKGPIFSNIILADEINRATPKTQSALIECMEEHQVTVDGATSSLEAPFLVIATENPIEHAGTYPLPEAQLDRFLIKVHMGYPKGGEELEIINRFFADSPMEQITQVCDQEEVNHMAAEARKVVVDDTLRALVVQIIERTRTCNEIEIGASPRAALALMRAIRSYAYVNGRRECCIDDIKAMAIPVLAHRMKLKPMNLAGTKSQEDIIKEIVWNYC